MLKDTDVEELFSPEALALDEQWLAVVRANRQGWVSADDAVPHLRRIIGCDATAAEVLTAAAGSELLVVEGRALRKKHPLRRISYPDTQSRAGECVHMIAWAFKC